MCRDYDSKTSNYDAKNVVDYGFTREVSQPQSRGCLKDHGLVNMQNAKYLHSFDFASGFCTKQPKPMRLIDFRTTVTIHTSSSVGFFTSQVLSINEKGLFSCLAETVEWDFNASADASPSITILIVSKPTKINKQP